MMDLSIEKGILYVLIETNPPLKLHKKKILDDAVIKNNSTMEEKSII